MQSLDVREDYSPAAHRFFALSRLFMSHHPTTGAAHIAINLGDYLPYRLGWNVTSDEFGDKYVWIGTQEAEGRTTRERPNGVADSEIYRKPPKPPFSGSHALGFFNRAVSALTLELGEDQRRSEIFRIHHNVLQSARFDQSQLDEWSSEIAHSMNESLREALSGPQYALSGLVNPAKNVIAEYLSFSVPGAVVREVLASYLVHLIDLFPSPSVMLRPPTERNSTSFEASRVDRIISLFLHLRERTASLLIERKDFNLPSFYEMTYLSILLGDVGLMLGRMLIDRVRVAGEIREKILRNQMVLDEELSHAGVATFLFPALFSEFLIPGEVKIIRKTPRPTSFVYPQLDGTDATPDDPRHVFNVLLEKTSGMPAFDVIGSLEQKNQLLDEQNRRELTQNLLWLTFGKGTM